MSFDRQAGGHNFDFSTEACATCGMSREEFEDTGKPPCKGKPSAAKTRRQQPLTVSDE
jgi:hypothetical protein